MLADREQARRLREEAAMAMAAKFDSYTEEEEETVA
jgi:hypothetical protein